MKVTLQQKDILLAQDKLVAHCCNTRNTMNSGVARVLRDRFPEIYTKDTASYLLHGKELLGKSIIVELVTDLDKTNIKYVANLYGQPNYGYDGARYVNYEAIYRSLEELKKQAIELAVNSLGMPYCIASNRAGGHWPIVKAMIYHVFEDTELEINFYEYTPAIDKKG